MMTMTSEALREKLPSAEDLLHALGLQYQRTGTGSGALGMFVLGAIAGAAAALLLAPSAGRELRQEVRDQMGSWRERAAETFRTRRAEDERSQA